MDTISEYVGHLQTLGLHPIPLDPFSKVTHLSGWAVPGSNTTEAFFAQAERLYGPVSPDTPLAEWFGKHGRNIGNLNTAARTLVLDCDDERAWAALKAAGAAIGIEVSPRILAKTTWARWKSVRGEKMAWRVPKGTEGARLSVRDRLGDRTTYRCIVEFRAGGQDVLPPSVRGDTVPPFVLDWAEDITEQNKLFTAPPIVMQLLAALRSSKDAQRAAYIAAGGDPAGFGMDPSSNKHYPPALAACIEERATANRIPLVELLSHHGYIQNGRRWAPADSRHADGILVDPEGSTGFCFHESEPISGQIDSWRLMVELGFEGNLASAVAAMRGHKREALGGAAVPTPKKNPAEAGAGREERSKKRPKREELQGNDKPVDIGSQPGVNLYDLYQTTLPEKDWRFRGLMNLTPGLYLLAGKPKHGKTYLAQGMAFAAATGASYAGTRGGPMRVLYISVDELDRAKIQGRLKQWLKGHPCPASIKNFDIYYSWPRGEAGIAALEQYLLDHPDTAFIIIDTLVAFRQQGADEGSRGVYQAEADEVHLFAEFAHKHRLVMLLLHHMRKGKIEMDDPFDAISGTNGIQGSTDGNIVLHRVKSEDEDGAKHVMVWCRTRDHEETDAHLVFHEGVYVHDGPAWVAEHIGTRQMVLETMRIDLDKAWTALEVYQHLHEQGAECGSKQNVANTMHRMGKAGLLIPPDRRHGKGGYRTPAPTAVPV